MRSRIAQESVDLCDGLFLLLPEEPYVFKIISDLDRLLQVCRRESAFYAARLKADCGLL